MAEVLVEFESSFNAPDGKIYKAQTCARERADGAWEGWLEFAPVDGSTPVRTGRETTQPKREDIMYWATGLTTTYIEGALIRVLATVPPVVGREVDARPLFDAPADTAHPVLDPFHVYAEGEDILRQQLNALDIGRLRTIIRGYDIATEDQIAVADHAELVSLIMAAVARRAA